MRLPPLYARRTQPARPNSGAGELYYVGRRPTATEVYVVTRRDVTPLPHRAYRSRAAFDWGRESPGSLELTFALLAHTAQSEPTDLVCAAFRSDVVERLDDAGFMLSASAIAIWLLTAFGDPDRP